MSWVGVMQTIAEDEFATAFLLYECCNKRVQNGNYLEKSWEINKFLTLIDVFLFNNPSLILIPPLKHIFSTYHSVATVHIRHK